MLSAVLRSEHALQMSIAIVRSFVRMRELISQNKDVAVRIDKLERSQDRTSSLIEVPVKDIDRLAQAQHRLRLVDRFCLIARSPKDAAR